MFTITTALAEQHRREMLAQADAARAAHRAVTRNTKRTAQGALVLAATAAIAASLVGLASAQATTPTTRAASTTVHALTAQHKIGPTLTAQHKIGFCADRLVQGRSYVRPGHKASAVLTA